MYWQAHIHLWEESVSWLISAWMCILFLPQRAPWMALWEVSFTWPLNHCNMLGPVCMSHATLSSHTVTTITREWSKAGRFHQESFWYRLLEVYKLATGTSIVLSKNGAQNWSSLSESSSYWYMINTLVTLLCE